MKIHILIQGDRSVGLPDGEIVVEEKGMDIPTTIAERMEKRGDYFNAFQSITDEPFEVYFEDECVDCGQIMMDNKCDRLGCISNIRIDTRDVEVGEDSLLYDYPEN